MVTQDNPSPYQPDTSGQLPPPGHQPVYGQPYGPQPVHYQPYAQQYPDGQPYPQPPAPPRRSRRVWWVALTYVVVFVLLAGAAVLVTPLVFSSSRQVGIDHPGPASVEVLKNLLSTPSGAEADQPQTSTIESVATAVDQESARAEMDDLREHGFRWAASVSWTGDDGKSEGTLRLTQFRTAAGARAHYSKLIGSEREILTAEETSIVEVPGAALFTEENRTDGEMVRATFGRGVIAGHIEVTDGAPHVRDDVLSLVLDVADGLPGDMLEWAEPAVTPVDLAALLISPPGGARQVSTPEEYRLLGLVEIFVSAEGGEQFLLHTGFRRGVTTNWLQDAAVGIDVSLHLFGETGGAVEYGRNSQESVIDLHPDASREEFPGLSLGAFHYYTEDGFRVGAATFHRGNIEVEIYMFSARVIDRATFAALAQEQLNRLPA